MPSIRISAGAVTNNLLDGEKFGVIPGGGAIVNMWGSSVTVTDTFGLSIGNQDIVVQGTEYNIEIAADAIDTARDQLVFNEVVPAGQLFLPIGAVTTEAQFLLHIRYL